MGELTTLHEESGKDVAEATKTLKQMTQKSLDLDGDGMVSLHELHQAFMNAGATDVAVRSLNFCRIVPRSSCVRGSMLKQLLTPPGFGVQELILLLSIRSQLQGA